MLVVGTIETNYDDNDEYFVMEWIPTPFILGCSLRLYIYVSAVIDALFVSVITFFISH